MIPPAAPSHQGRPSKSSSSAAPRPRESTLPWLRLRGRRGAEDISEGWLDRRPGGFGGSGGGGWAEDDVSAAGVGVGARPAPPMTLGAAKERLRGHAPPYSEAGPLRGWRLRPQVATAAVC